MRLRDSRQNLRSEPDHGERKKKLIEAVETLSLYGDKLDCHTCDEKLREERGHDREGIIPFWFGGKQVKRCPLMLITPLSWEYIRAYGFYQKSMLPNGMGTNNESRKYLQAMSIIEKVISSDAKREHRPAPKSH